MIGMAKAPECFGGFKFELTEEEQKEYENNRRIMHEAETEYLYHHGDFRESRKREFWDTLNLLFDGSNDVPLRIIGVVGTGRFNRIIENAADEIRRLKREGADNSNRAFWLGVRESAKKK